ncbi:MAG: hypothetical protein HYV94_05905 [Candidatus Rokubacteria bacterium]|nr:hypothetical protein [Candidatus Rokubacteria bacterium]
MSGAELAALLERRGFDFAAGVPCSLIEDLIAALERDPRGRYVAAPREDAAVGLAGGAWLAGRRPAVLMQNSGLGTSLNALASFSLMYGLPCLLVVTWRGFQGKDAPEHILTGQITPSLLELLGIPHRVLARDSIAADLDWARREMDTLMQPVALVIPPGVLETGHGSAAGGGGPGETRGSGLRGIPGHRMLERGVDSVVEPSPPPPAADPTPRPTRADEQPGRQTPESLRPVISRREAIAEAVKQLGDEPLIHANGYICRESFSVADRPQNFYMIGSMGLASAIGLGVALARPARRAVVFDGDGNLLMNLGVVGTVGALAPKNFVHLVFDNEVYGSTGNQASPSRAVRLDRIARAAGYRTAAAVTAPDEVGAALRAALATDGPHFVLVKVTTGEADVPRIPHTPHAIRDRFRAAVQAP